MPSHRALFPRALTAARAIASSLATLAFALGAIAAAAVSSPADAAVILVPEDQPTIQAAIDVAVDGDEIDVAPGTYNETIDFVGKAIRVFSRDGRDTTTIDATGLDATAVVCASGEAQDSILEGFTVTGGAGAEIEVEPGAVMPVGGGMRNVGTSPTVRDCVFTGNSADRGAGGRGGGMFNTGGDPVVDGCVFSLNDASIGGGMYSMNGAAPRVTDCSFTDNTAVTGGAMANRNGNARVTRTNFRDNAGDGSGGAVHNRGGAPLLVDCVFVDNTAGGREGGGAIRGIDCDLIVIDSNFTGNGAIDGPGGAAQLAGGTVLFASCTFLGNDATSGGALDIDRETDFTVAVSRLLGNDAVGGAGAGGGIRNQAILTAVNTLLSGNNAVARGGGVANLGVGDALLTNCTLGLNVAPAGGAVHNSNESGGGATVAMNNAIAWGNGPDPLIAVAGAMTIVTYSDIEGGFAGAGNVDTDPAFVDADGGDDTPGTPDDDARLMAGSPVIDAADADALSRCSLDLDGNVRHVDDPDTADTGIGDAPIVDMGAYEFGAPAGGDCNLNGIDDACGIVEGSEADCNTNDTPDDCDIAAGVSDDCNANGRPDTCEIADDPSVDCNENGIPDDCDIEIGTSRDCNENGIPDECDIADGTSDDCDMNGVPDECDLGLELPGTLEMIEADFEDLPLDFNFACDDCHTGRRNLPFAVTIGDETFVAFRQSANGFVELLRQGENVYAFGLGGVDDLIASGSPSHTYLMAAFDDLISSAFGNWGYKSEADRVVFTWLTETFCDRTLNLLNEFQIILHDDGTVRWNFNTAEFQCFDHDLFSGIYLGHDRQELFEIARETIPVGESWMFTPGPGENDCNGNGVPDACDIADGTSEDCNENGKPDECDIADGTSEDEDEDGVPDECPLCPADFDMDGEVSFQDLVFLLARFGPCPKEGECIADIDGNGEVDFGDLVFLLARFGPCE